MRISASTSSAVVSSGGGGSAIAGRKGKGASRVVHLVHTASGLQDGIIARFLQNFEEKNGKAITIRNEKKSFVGFFVCTGYTRYFCVPGITVYISTVS